MPDATAQLPTPDQIEPASKLIRTVLEQLDRILLGRSELHRLVAVGILARGHILLEGLPGVGKTALVKALGQLLGLEFKGVQFTPDLMPGDILGTHILQPSGGDNGGRAIVFEPGPVFTNILLADEINRASPKTQSAMLEAMQERQVSLMGTTRPLPDPFFVLASQNPIELEGTYPLPEAQLDRFLFKLNVTDVNAATLESIITSRRRGEPPTPEVQISGEELRTLFAMMDRIFLPRPVAKYISRLVAATHPQSEATSPDVGPYIQYGASPRAAIAMAEAARGMALVHGRPTVGFEDVKAVAPAVLNHRLILNYKARFDKIDSGELVQRLLASVDEAGLGLPADVQVVAGGAA